MNDRLSRLAGCYAGTLRRFMADEQEASLEEAYELGRGAIAQGLGILDLARIHQHALAEMLLQPAPGSNPAHTLHAAGIILLESLAPFESTHRGFQQTNHELQQLIVGMEKRNGELAEINRRLKSEISVRRRTEKALRDSERHYRRLFTEARHMQNRLRQLSSRILNIQEEERLRISRELHDEAGQALTAISVTLAGLRGGAPGSSSGGHLQKLDKAQRLIENTMEAMHNFARELRPTVLDELGLLPALRSHLANFAERTGLEIRFRATRFAEQLGRTEKTVLFRVTQESLDNIARHAQASRVDFQIRKCRGQIHMSIADDGQSLVASPEGPMRRRQRLGLLGMQERVRLVNGHCTIQPRQGQGTRVCVTLPLRSPAAENAGRKNFHNGSQDGNGKWCKLDNSKTYEKNSRVIG